MQNWNGPCDLHALKFAELTKFEVAILKTSLLSIVINCRLQLLLLVYTSYLMILPKISLLENQVEIHGQTYFSHLKHKRIVEIPIKL